MWDTQCSAVSWSYRRLWDSVVLSAGVRGDCGIPSVVLAAGVRGDCGTPSVVLAAGVTVECGTRM